MLLVFPVKNSDASSPPPLEDLVETGVEENVSNRPPLPSATPRCFEREFVPNLEKGWVR